jgi:hypothetical protein
LSVNFGQNGFIKLTPSRPFWRSANIGTPMTAAFPVSSKVPEIFLKVKFSEFLQKSLISGHKPVIK